MKNVLKLKDSSKPAESKQEDNVLELYMDYVGDDGYVYKHNGKEYYKTNISLQGPKGNPGPKGRDGLTPNIGQNGNWYIGGKDTQVKAKGSGEIKKITYSELKNLRDNSNLSPGCYYRIIDYQCTTTQEGTQSAGHQFDIIVRADDKYALNENAYAIEHENDSYFDNANLGAWELKYCLDNDTNRFAWADTENGKGVIYYMKDEWDNIAPFDFKNMLFTRNTEWFGDHETWAEDVLGEVPETDLHFYFLSWVTEDGEIQDASIVGQTLPNDEGTYSGVYGNKIKETSAYQMDLTEDSTSFAFALPCTIIVNSYSEGGVFYGCDDNTFGTNCDGNTFGGNCSSNTFGNQCSDNIFGHGCDGNTFGNNCFNNTFGNYCQNNMFGNRCRNIMFGSSGTIQSYYNNIIFESGNRNINFTCSQTTSSSSKCQNILVALGVNNTSTTKTITIDTVNQTNRTVVRSAADTEITL